MGDIYNSFLKKREDAKRIYDCYSKQLLHSLKMAEKNVVRKEFSRGGECLHRGFYCPSPVLDIVIGGCKRGKRIKNPKKVPDYEYWFDSDDKLILVRTPNIPDGCDSSAIGYELIYNHDGFTESVIFQIDADKTVRISGLTRCNYQNGRIESYDFIEVSGNPFVCYDIRNELFFYENGILTSSVLQGYNFTAEMMGKRKYFYNYNSDGKMVSYTVEEWDENGRMPDFWDGHVFKVTSK